jgi:hypothetical protein
MIKLTKAINTVEKLKNVTSVKTFNYPKSDAVTSQQFKHLEIIVETDGIEFLVKLNKKQINKSPRLIKKHIKSQLIEDNEVI